MDTAMFGVTAIGLAFRWLLISKPSLRHGVNLLLPWLEPGGGSPGPASERVIARQVGECVSLLVEEAHINMRALRLAGLGLVGRDLTSLRQQHL